MFGCSTCERISASCFRDFTEDSFRRCFFRILTAQTMPVEGLHNVRRSAFSQALYELIVSAETVRVVSAIECLHF